MYLCTNKNKKLLFLLYRRTKLKEMKKDDIAYQRKWLRKEMEGLKSQKSLIEEEIKRVQASIDYYDNLSNNQFTIEL